MENSKLLSEELSSSSGQLFGPSPEAAWERAGFGEECFIAGCTQKAAGRLRSMAVSPLHLFLTSPCR